MQAIRIALDVDGVLADTMRSWLSLCNSRFSMNLTYDQIDKWNFWRDKGMEESDMETLFNQAWEDWEKMPSTEDNLSKKVELLHQFGDVDIVTARNSMTITNVTKWLDKQKIKRDRIVVVEPDQTKGHLDYDVFIDDSPLNLLDIADRGKFALCYDQPWNRDVSQRENLLRIRGLSDACARIRSLLNSRDG